MGTRAAAFTIKIKNLQEAQLRLMQSPSTSGQTNPPNGIELATTLKWFSTTLLNVLKDVPGQPFVMMKNKENDPERMALYPSLDYKGLYSTLLNFIDLVQYIPQQGLYDFGKAYLNTLCSMVPFLERELIDTLPYMCCAMLTVLPASLYQDVINTVCWHLIPFTICLRRPKDNLPLTEDVSFENYATKSASAMLMMVFQFCKDNSAIHRQIMEALMAVKEDLAKDLLCVVAHGTPSARLPAANLLFYYWPSLNPTLYDLKAVINKFNSTDSWIPPLCCAPECAGKGSALAVKMCLDHTICMSHHQDRPPPGFYCRDCFLTIQRLIDSRDVAPMFQDISHPMQNVSITCDYQKCKSIDKTAVAICFSQDCSSFNGTDHRPTRYCHQCNKICHQSRRTMDHITHGCLPSPWDMDQETQNYLVKAVVGLLQEARPFGSNRELEETHRRTMLVLDDDDQDCEDEATANERRLLSRYGVWLLVGLSTPNADTNIPTFGHMLSMLFQWFNATAYLPNDKTGTALEKLKSEYIPEWLQSVYKTHPDVFVTCLLPNPPDYARIGGHWDVLLPKIDHIKEGLVRFFCLVPYDVITLEVWEKLMSHWMEAINKEVKKEELSELKNIFSKIFDPDMSPLGFDAREMYQFISKRFVRTLADIQQQALQWLQKLCRMQIHIPLNILFDMFNSGIETLHKDGEDIDQNGPVLIVDVCANCPTEEDILGPSDSSEHQENLIEEENDEEAAAQLISKEELNLTCYNLMLDVLISQLQLQDVEKNVGLMGPHSSEILSMINTMLATPWFSAINKCLVDTVDLDDLEEDEEVGIRAVEELLTDFLQLAHGVISNVIQLDPTGDSDEEGQDAAQHTIHSGSDLDPKAVNAMKKGPGLGQFMAVLTTMQSHVEKVKEAEDSSSISSQEESDDPFELKIEDYPIALQLVYHLLLRNTELVDPDMRYYLLNSVRVLTLNADVLQGAARKHKKFILHCQEMYLTGILWHILDAAHSQVAQVSIPILLHSITLPGGAELFWKALDEDFNDEDWRVRFAATEKVTLLLRFLEDRPVKKSNALKSVLSHAFCCLIASMDDIDVHISQRSTLYLGTIHDTSIKTVLNCLEHQFDMVPIDRPVILKRLYQLFNCLIDRKILTWQFFASRFDSLISDLQLTYGNKSDFLNTKAAQTKKNSTIVAAAVAESSSSLQGMGHTSIKSRIFQRSGGGDVSVRSLSSSLKFPYKRTISAPAGMGLSIASKNHIQTSKSKYGRQQSAPTMHKARLAKTLTDSGHTLNKQISNVAAVVDDMEYVNIASKILDMDEVDKEAVHLLVFLFMQFLSHPEQATIPKEEKHGKVNSALSRCFQSLFSLLGYNESERRFQVMPHKVRSTAAVNAFFANLPQVLDYNIEIGKLILLNCILILQKIPFPPRYAISWQQAQTLMQERMLFQGCGFSLWYLEPTLRKNWLMSAVVILYKYDFNTDAVLGEKSIGIIRIILHTLANHAHACDRFNRPSIGQMARSRDLSQLSIGDSERQEDNVFDKQDSVSPGDEESGDIENASQGSVYDDHDPELQPIFEKAKSSGSSSSPEKTSSEFLESMVETHPNPTGSSENIRVPMAHMFGFLPRPSTTAAKSAPTPSDHQLSAEGLPPGWTMQLMTNGRTLFIDNANQVTTWIDPRTGKLAEMKDTGHHHLHHLPMFESPPSPLSLMDVITVGSPIAVDKYAKSTSSSSAATVISPEANMDPPTEERLLPIGGGTRLQDVRRGESAPGREGIIDRVWEVFGYLEQETSPLMSNNPEKSGSALKYQTKIEKIPMEDLTDPNSNQKNGKQTSSSRGHNKIEVIETEKTLEPKKSSLKKKGGGQSNLEKNDSKVEIHISHDGDNTTRKKGKKRKKHPTGEGHQEGLANAESSSKASSVCGGGKYRENSSSSLLSTNRDNPLLFRQSALRVGEDCIIDRCSNCGAIMEEYSEDEIGHCIIVLNMFVNRDPALAAPLLPEILITLTRIANRTQYSWELDTNAYIPANARSVARQAIRCILHQLSGNGIFSKLFLMDMQDTCRQKFINTLVQCMLDFTDLSPAVPVALFMQEMNNKKTLTIDDFDVCLPNMACYFRCVQFDFSGSWAGVFVPAEMFFRRLWTMTGTPIKTGSTSQTGTGTQNLAKVVSKVDPDNMIQIPQIESLFHVMTGILRMPGAQGYRQILDPLAKLVSYGIQNCTIKFIQLLSMCHFCNRSFVKERDKQLITRAAILELVQALKFKTTIPDSNFLLLTNLVLYDAGGELAMGIYPESSFTQLELDSNTISFNTAACEVMKNNMTDVIEFLADVHTLSKVKSNVKGHNIGLNEDTLGGILKASLAQYLALEISKGNGRDTRTANKYLPWLFNPPGNTATQAPKEFLDCVAHIRLLSWLLLGAVNHTLKFGSNEAVVCQPIPLDASCHIADHIQVILAGFAEQSKTSVVHMCSLFHAFILCQLWTVYLEQTIALLPPRDDAQVLASSILLDFWGKVTPGILQLVSHSKVLAEMVNLHFLYLMEALMECRSTILVKLTPLWTPVLFAYNTQLPDHVRVRLQAIQDYKPPDIGLDEQTTNNLVLVKWLQRLQFKIGQIEMQASTVTQFFTV